MNDASPKQRPYHLTKPHVDDYVRGFVLAVVLTVMAFSVVLLGNISRRESMIFITVLAIAQVGVHLRYFLHYSTDRAPFEATIAMVMVVFISAVFVLGGLWVMTDLNMRMMP